MTIPRNARWQKRLDRATDKRLAITASLAALIAAAPVPAIAAATHIVIPSSPSGKAFWSSANDDFTVRIRTPGGEWRDLYEYNVRVDNDTVSNATAVFFDIDGPVEVQVRKNNGTARAVSVRPRASGVRPSLANDAATFTLAGPRKVSVEFDGDHLHNLHLFAGPIIGESGWRPGPGVTIFGPGNHQPPGGAERFRIRSGETWYMEPGAILEGGIDIFDAHDVRLIGHGVIAKAKGEGIAVARSDKVTVDGAFVLNPGHYSFNCGQSTNITIKDFKAVSQGSWTDGIDTVACSNVTIDDIFMRNSDDTIAIYGGRGPFTGPATHFRVTNAILWADLAHAVNIGLHGTKGSGDDVGDLFFTNIDVLEHDEDDHDYQGALAISNGDNNRVHDVTFEKVRISRIEEGSPFNFRVVSNKTYNWAPGAGISNVRLRDVLIDDPGTTRPVIAGFSGERGVRGVVLENVRMQGRALRLSDINVGPDVSGLVIKGRPTKR